MQLNDKMNANINLNGYTGMTVSFKYLNTVQVQYYIH